MASTVMKSCFVILFTITTVNGNHHNVLNFYVTVKGNLKQICTSVAVMIVIVLSF